jgi:hypothetical protein
MCLMRPFSILAVTFLQPFGECRQLKDHCHISKLKYPYNCLDDCSLFASPDQWIT